MTPKEFRKIALAFDGAVESSHMGHPDFRVGGRIFATLGAAGQGRGMVKLTPQQQQSFLQADPDIFAPCNGAWGRQGCTNVDVAAASKTIVKAALQVAFENVAERAKEPRKPAQRRQGKPPSAAPRLKKSSVDKARNRVTKIVDSLPEAAANPVGDGHLSLEVRGKRFGYFVVDHHGDGRLALHLKAARGVSKRLTSRSKQFHIPSVLGRFGWVGVWLDLPQIDWQEVSAVMVDAYRLAAPKTLSRGIV